MSYWPATTFIVVISLPFFNSFVMYLYDYEEIERRKPVTLKTYVVVLLSNLYAINNVLMSLTSLSLRAAALAIRSHSGRMII